MPFLARNLCLFAEHRKSESLMGIAPTSHYLK
nr:MAG TPA: hypothetical protein [Caudoviricetes sp.]